MRFVDLKCPNCGGRLIPVEGNQKIVACEYCKSQYVLEDDRVINYHVHQHIEQGQGGGSQSRSSGPAGILAASLVFIAVAVLFVAGIGAGSVIPPKPGVSINSRTSLSPAADRTEEEAEESSPEKSPFYDVLVRGIYGKPAESVTTEEREKLRYLSIRNSRDNFYVDYSFEEVYGDGEQTVQSLALEPADWDTDDLVSFPGLEKLELSYRWADGEVLKELKNLKGLRCCGSSPAELAEWLDPEQLVELGIKEPESLEGLSSFVNLEILCLDEVKEPDLRQLAPLGRLRSLEIVEETEGGDPFSDEPVNKMTDYSALSVLTGLERLHLESEGIREVSFLKSLTGLKELSLRDTEAISLEPLADLSQLTVLELADNDSLKDYQFIPALTGLTSLVLDKSTSQPDPDLSDLGRLENLDICGLMSVGSLGRLTNLKNLSLHGCNVDEIQALSSLTGLERLACYSVWTYGVPLRDLGFLDGMTNLKYLDLCGVSDEGGWSGYGRKMEIYGDISNVLNHPGLEELYLNEGMFGIEFGRLQDNPSLRKLQMKEVSLKENFHVEVYSGMMDVWYDDVAMDEHTEFFRHYPNLEELSLDGNQLTNVRFAADLKKLVRLGLNNNYVTDLTPLNQAESLRYLDVRQNPVSNMPEAEGDIRILR